MTKFAIETVHDADGLHAGPDLTWVVGTRTNGEFEALAAFENEIKAHEHERLLRLVFEQVMYTLVPSADEVLAAINQALCESYVAQ